MLTLLTLSKKAFPFALIYLITNNIIFFLLTKHLRDINPRKHSAKVLSDVFYTRNNFKTTIVVSRSCVTGDAWYLVTNDNPSHAVRNYSYRFGSVECIFKSQKTNRL